jgi:membrane-associated progesterone receptor component
MFDDNDVFQVWCGVVSAAVFLMFMKWCQLRNTQVVDLPPKQYLVPRGYTAEDLAPCNGVERPEILIGVKGIVYNVSPQWYGPAGPYHAFAGAEASRQLGKTIVATSELNADWTTMTADHIQALREWEERFKAKYYPVGWFVPDAEGKYYERGRVLPP